MTKEEAKLLVEKKCHSGVEVVDKIYNDFESRICKHCKYYSDNKLLQRFCKNHQLKIKPPGLYFIPQSEDFGCNRFERKVKKG